MNARLRLVPGERPRPSASGLAQRQQRYAPWLGERLTQWHFVIDDRPLRSHIAAVNEDATLGEDVSIADGAWADLALPLVQSLQAVQLADPDWVGALEPGRFPLYVCSECADLGCGALTVAVERQSDGDAVTWSDFRFEDGNTPLSEHPSLAGLGPFTFSAERYEAAFEQPLREMADMAERLTVAERAWKAQRSPAARLRHLAKRLKAGR